MGLLIKSIVYGIFFIFSYNTIGTYFELEIGEVLLASFILTVAGAGLAIKLAKGGVYIIIGLILIQIFLFFQNGSFNTSEIEDKGNYLVEQIKDLFQR